MTGTAYDAIKAVLTGRLSARRLAHTTAVAETAAALAARYGADQKAAMLAGLLHDSAREFAPDQLLSAAASNGVAIDPVERCEPLLLHGKVGAALAQTEFAVDDEEILAAIATHITGAPGMGLLQRLVFLADFIEPGRTFPAAQQARLAAEQDLRRALLIAYDAIITYVVTDGYLLHPWTVSARNELLGCPPGPIPAP